jgi:DNA/RNA-binding domain of Phe-tRNA-synthetase-like protein
MELSLAPHPLLDARVFVTRYLPDVAAHASQSPLADPPPSPFPEPDANLRSAIRDVLRHAGYKPTGRAKPASEYLVRAQGEGGLKPINFAVDACNLVSLYSGIPISVVDLDLLAHPLAIAVAEPGASYVFNQAGQSIDVGHLLCLFDANGPCANAVKDAQRTKTTEATRATLTVLWSSRQLQDYTTDVLAFYLELLTRDGVDTELVNLV